MSKGTKGSKGSANSSHSKAKGPKMGGKYQPSSLGK